ncbi:uncharacterized protein LOC9644225 isoform X2 [Selaginella moellendorffii]|nr:uncharacterized protein LOC9644225 isoform X2 [Selaginella moellendorffii]|eukprot:XP_002983983.2 uncharacterized protein LOC9644225 isoform X2 [Selaginella moellendorffii]
MDRSPKQRCVEFLISPRFASNVLVFVLAVTAAASGLIGNLTRNLKAAPSGAATIFSEISEYSNLRILRQAIERAKLREFMSDHEKCLTLFAPTDSAFESVLHKRLLPCVTNHYNVNRCSSLDQLLSSTSLNKLLLNHVVDGNLSLDSSAKESFLHFLGDSVEKLVKNETGHASIGNAAVIVANVRVGNGMMHLIDNVLGSVDPESGLSSDVSLDAEAVLSALKLTDADFFNVTKRQEMAEGAKALNIPGFQRNRNQVGYPDGGLTNAPVLVFDPSMNEADFTGPDTKFSYPSLASGISRPSTDEDLAFMTILELGALLKSKQVTSVELVKVFSERLKRYDSTLKAVVTYTEELAQAQSLAADKLLQQGTYLGPLHGIPYGLKDTIAVPGYRTTWGSTSFKDQFFNEEAFVYTRLKEAGAVLIAKLATGSLAYDDIWFGGRTRNPWNIEEFSTGSSCGPAAATSAGTIPFAIGSETAGSISYPAARTGVTAFRPTFGMVSRWQIMSLSESLDKIGPFGRSIEDCTIVLDVLRGKDPRDLSSKNIKLKDPFSIDAKKLTVGYLPDAEMEVVRILKEQGVKMVPFDLKYSVDSAQQILNFTMDVDMLAHFDHWQRAGLDDAYEAQDQWPVELRRARLISAVDYVQAQRARHKLISEVLEALKGIDAFIGNATDWEKVAVGNLVGMPVAIIPAGLKSIQNPPPEGTRRRTTVTAGIYARPYGDSEVLALAMAFQKVTKHHLQRPPVDNVKP